MSIFEKIKKVLDDNQIGYQIFEHKPVYTSKQAAAIRDEDPSIGAKSIVFFVDQKPILIVVPGDKKIDTNKFRRDFRVKDLRMAKPEEVKKICGIEIGSIPPWGSVMRLKTYFDETLAQKPMIVFNAGLHTVSIKMKTGDFLALEKPTIGQFSR